MKRFKIILGFGCMLIFTICNSMDYAKRNHNKLITKYSKRFSPYNKLPSRFRKESLTVYYHAHLEQYDKFSCGHRVLFYAECLESAAQEAQMHNDIFKSCFLRYVKDTKRLADIYTIISGYLYRIDPAYNQLENGLYDFHLAGICQKELPILQEKLIPIKVKENTLNVLHNPIATQNLLRFSDEYLQDKEFEIFDKKSCYKPLEHSPEFAFQLERLKNKAPFVYSHFACLTKGHWILASLFNNRQGRTRLAFMDSQNFTVQQNALMAVIFEKFLPYIHMLNGN